MSFKFRDWQVYKDLRKFRQEVIKNIIPIIPKEEKLILVPQLKRALNSAILNIAEGAYRKSDKELARFLNQADTSLNEVVACFDICLDDAYINQSLHKKLIEKIENINAQIAGFRRFLKNTQK